MSGLNCPRPTQTTLVFWAHTALPCVVSGVDRPDPINKIMLPHVSLQGTGLSVSSLESNTITSSKLHNWFPRSVQSIFTGKNIENISSGSCNKLRQGNDNDQLFNSCVSRFRAYPYHMFLWSVMIPLCLKRLRCDGLIYYLVGNVFRWHCLL